jgi:hypothetical protein
MKADGERPLRYSALLLLIVALAFVIAAIHLFTTPFHRMGGACALLAMFFLLWARNCWFDVKKDR